MASIENTWGFRKGPAGRKPSLEPRYPEKVLEIVRLREEKNLRWRQIGPMMGMSYPGAQQLYQKWHVWAERKRYGTS